MRQRRHIHAVIAVKRLDRAKTRLADHFTPADRARLVLAMLDDTLVAALAVDTIGSATVVTLDPEVTELAHRRGARVHVEPNDGAGGLNAALTAAARNLRTTVGPGEIVALQADLPAMRPHELAQALAVAPMGTRSLVRDHHRTGTAALLVRDPYAALDPRFGPASAQRHCDAGAVDLDGDWPGLRLDVDTAEDLTLAMGLGVGRATGTLLADLDRVGRVRPGPMPRVS